MATFQRARSDDDKAVRRGSMLSAAREVAQESGVRQVTLTAIAARTGLHKSAVLRYFANREALLLDLCRQEWQGWAAELAQVAEAAVNGRHLPSAILSESLERRPLFCDLLAQTQVALERDAPVEIVREFKLDVLAALDVAAAAVQRLSGDLSRQQSAQLVGVAVTLAGTLWHVAHPPPALRAVYESDPRLAAACVDFAPALTTQLDTFTAGMACTPPPGSP